MAPPKPDGPFLCWLGGFGGNQIIGICCFVPLGRSNFKDLETAGELIQLYVKSKYRRNGIGLRLVEEMVKEGLQIPGIDQIILGVKEDNLQAIRIYEKAGFFIYESGDRNGELLNPDSLRMIRFVEKKYRKITKRSFISKEVFQLLRSDLFLLPQLFPGLQHESDLKPFPM